jgi:hypothetical protein
MSEMIERVARAIAKARHPGLTWPTKSDPEYIQTVHTYLRDARAAIEAMLEPTQDMADAAINLDVYWAYSGEGFGMPEDVWSAMIDAALNGNT